MSDAIAPVPISDETTRRLFGEPSFRVAKRGGYDPGDVAEFLERLGGQVVTFVGRLRDAESRLEVAETELAHWKGRTRTPRRPARPSSAPSPWRRTPPTPPSPTPATGRRGC